MSILMWNYDHRLISSIIWSFEYKLKKLYLPNGTKIFVISYFEKHKLICLLGLSHLCDTSMTWLKVLKVFPFCSFTFTFEEMILKSREYINNCFAKASKPQFASIGSILKVVNRKAYGVEIVFASGFLIQEVERYCFCIRNVKF